MAAHSFAGSIFNLLTLLVFLSPNNWLVTCQNFQTLKPSFPQSQPSLNANGIPAWPPNARTTYTPTPKAGFVTTKNGHLYLNGELFDFRSFNSPTVVPKPTVYEVVDVVRSITGFAVPATRSYTLAVANDKWGGNMPLDNGHISGWDADKNDWKYNENVWRGLDKMLSVCAEEGVKIIFPLINQDYGKESTDFVGNFNDLIRHRYNISDYKQAQARHDWFTDIPLREDFKKLIHFFLTRKNTVNGRIYGQDDTFLAIETGNEMNWAEITYKSTGNGTTNSTTPSSAPNTTVAATSANTSNTVVVPGNGTLTFDMTHTRPAPANWTIDIARYIKSLAPNILVMDGSYARNKNITEAWPVESLQSPDVDLFSYHYYGDEDIPYVSECQARVESFGKTFIVGEHGFYSNASAYRTFYESFKGAGSLIWSLRGHSEVSGFQTHSEGNNIYSLHVPGFRNQTSKKFDQNEYEIVRQTHQASFDVLGKPASFPVPGPTYPFFATNSTHTGISFKGAAWALYYEVWGGREGGTFTKVADNVFDNLDSGELFVAIDPSQPEDPLYVPPPTIIDYLLPQTGWTDNKWLDGYLTTITQPHWLRHRRRSIAHHPSRKSRRGLRTLDRRARNKATDGGWFSVRGIGVDGKPGPFSHPAYISASDEV